MIPSILLVPLFIIVMILVFNKGKAPSGALLGRLFYGLVSFVVLFFIAVLAIWGIISVFG